MSNADPEIETWSTSELLSFLDLAQDADPSEIQGRADQMIEEANAAGNVKATSFLVSLRNKLLSTGDVSQGEGDDDDDDDADQGSEQAAEWLETQYLTQSNTQQADKATSRFNQVDTFRTGSHPQMKRNTLGVNQTFPLPAAQGTINPTLRNLVDRMVVVDTQYRPNVYPFVDSDPNSASFTSSFTVTLSETLFNVISMELYAVQIPRAWYNIDPFIGNSCFGLEVLAPDGAEVVPYSIYSVPKGNYTINNLLTVLNTLGNGYVEFTQDPNSLLVTVKNTDETNVSIITWYQDGGFTASECAQCDSTMYSNTSLGWTLGDRTTPNVNGTETGWVQIEIPPKGQHVLDSTPDLNGPQYGFLVVDDFQKNRLNKGVVGIVETDNKLPLPQYTNADNEACDGDGNPTWVMTAPRKLTRKQLFTINSISAGRKESNNRVSAPTTNDVMATIPFAGSADVIALYGQDLLSNKRDYFGPVTIDRVKVQLVDDKGNLINMNGRDWSFTLKVSQLYQY